jgi:hypothetical protein
MRNGTAVAFPSWSTVGTSTSARNSSRGSMDEPISFRVFWASDSAVSSWPGTSRGDEIVRESMWRLRWKSVMLGGP